MTRTRYRHGELDQEVCALLKRQGFAPTVIFDVGASNGSWSRAIARVFPDAQYHLFEPLAEHADSYRELMQQTLREHPNFHLHPHALGAVCGEVTMHVWPDVVASTALDVRHPVEGARQITVPMLTLDEAVRSLDLPAPPQLVKIDTQGCELDILGGGQTTLPFVSVLYLECWLNRGYGESTPLLLEIAAWLSQLDFHLLDVGDEYRNPDGVLTNLDCVFVNARAGLTPSWYYA